MQERKLEGSSELEALFLRLRGRSFAHKEQESCLHLQRLGGNITETDKTV